MNKKSPIIRVSHVEMLNGRKYQSMDGSFVPSCTYKRILQVQTKIY
jgi:hypothetical protein